MTSGTPPALTAALDLIDAGWGEPFNLPPRAKAKPPTGTTGGAGVALTRDEVEAAFLAEPDANVGLRMRDGYIGLDIDHGYGGKTGDLDLAVLEHELGPLPPAPSSSSREGGKSRIMFFRTPENLRWHDPKDMDIEVIWRGHRYAVVPPSVHPEDRPYRWFDPEGNVAETAPVVADMEYLPEEWVDFLTSDRPAYGNVETTRGEALQYVADMPEGAPADAISEALKEFREGDASHPRVVGAVLDVLWHGSWDHPGAADALEEIRDAFFAYRRVKQRRESTESEWDRLLAWAVGRTKAKHGEAAVRDFVVVAFPSEEPSDPGEDAHGGHVGIKWPKGYSLDARSGGLTKKTKAEQGGYYWRVFARDPLAPVARWVDADSGAETLVIGFHRDGVWREVPVPREDVLAANKIVSALAGRGASVNSSNARDVVDFFVAFEDVNVEHIPVITSFSRLGWNEAGDRFFLPDDEHAEANPPAGLKRLFDAFRAGGSAEGQRSALAALADHPRAAVPLFANLASPLLRIVGAPSAVVSLAAESGTGKTTAAGIGGSVWGYPGRPSDLAGSVVSTWSATGVGLETLFGAFGDGMTLTLDEAQVASDDRIVRDAVYGLSTGEGKTRGARTGGLRETLQHRHLAVSTSERSLATYGGDQGLLPRIIEQTAPPFPPGSGELVERLATEVERHHGHTGREFIAQVLDRRGEWDQWREQYEAARDTLASHAETVVERRRAGVVAVLKMAADLAAAWGVLTFRPPDWLWVELLSGADDEDKVTQAAHVALRYIIEHRDSEFGDGAGGSAYGHRTIGRWDKGSDWAAIDPEVLRRVLRDAGFDLDALKGAWVSRGWLVTESDRHHHKRVRVAGERSYYVVFDLAPLREALGLDGVDDEEYEA